MLVLILEASIMTMRERILKCWMMSFDLKCSHKIEKIFLKTRIQDWMMSSLQEMIKK